MFEIFCALEELLLGLGELLLVGLGLQVVARHLDLGLRVRHGGLEAGSGLVLAPRYPGWRFFDNHCFLIFEVL